VHGYGCDLGCFIARCFIVCFDDKAVTRLAERNRECVVKRNTLAIVVLVKFLNVLWINKLKFFEEPVHQMYIYSVYL